METNRVRVTTLIDNIAVKGFISEWGLSLFIEAGGRRILFDTGASNLFLKNARRAGIDLCHLDAIVLSHGHMDHTGGLMAVLEMSGPVKVIAHPAAFTIKAVRRPGETAPRYIGMPFAGYELKATGAEFILSTGPADIAPGMTVSGEIPRVTPYEKGDICLMAARDGSLASDSVPDDQCLIITTAAGLVVVTGCCHRGIVNTLTYAVKLTGVETVAAVIGGLHLIRSTKEEVRDTLAGLRKFGVGRIIAAHCTGEYATEQLQEEYCNRCVVSSAGAAFDFS